MSALSHIQDASCWISYKTNELQAQSAVSIFPFREKKPGCEPGSSIPYLSSSISISIVSG